MNNTKLKFEIKTHASNNGFRGAFVYAELLVGNSTHKETILTSPHLEIDTRYSFEYEEIQARDWVLNKFVEAMRKLLGEEEK